MSEESQSLTTKLRKLNRTLMWGYRLYYASIAAAIGTMVYTCSKTIPGHRDIPQIFIKTESTREVISALETAIEKLSMNSNTNKSTSEHINGDPIFFNQMSNYITQLKADVASNITNKDYLAYHKYVEDRNQSNENYHIASILVSLGLVVTSVPFFGFFLPSMFYKRERLTEGLTGRKRKK